MTGIQRLRNKCLYYLQLEDRAKAEGKQQTAKLVRVLYRAFKLKLNAMRVRHNKLADLFIHHELHKQGVSFNEYVELYEASMETVTVEMIQKVKAEVLQHWTNLINFRYGGDVHPSHYEWLDNEINELEYSIVRGQFH